MKNVKLVGILNITPDSFSGDGIHNNIDEAVAQAADMFTSGATLIDVGAEATNPWAKPISDEEEWERLEPVLSRLMIDYPGKISVDTYHPETVRRVAALFGADFIVNDVTGMNNPKMREVVARHHLTCIISHLPDKFGTNIKKAHKNADVDDPQQVLEALLQRCEGLLRLGLPPNNIILDPGIGFGKTMELNWRLLHFPELVRGAGLENEVAIGYSHKRFLGSKRFEIQPNLDAALVAIDAGANYLRIHDVAPHSQLLQSL